MARSGDSVRLTLLFFFAGGCVAGEERLPPVERDGGMHAACAAEFAALPTFETIEGESAFSVVHRTQRECLLFSMTMTVDSPGWLTDWKLDVCSDCPSAVTLYSFGTSRKIEEMRGFEDAAGTTYLECPRAFDPNICTRAEICDVPNQPRVPMSRALDVGAGDEERFDFGVFNAYHFVTNGDWRTANYLDNPELRECEAWEVEPERPMVTADIDAPLRLVYSLPSTREEEPPRAPLACLNGGFGIPASCGWPVIENAIVGDVVRSPSFELPAYIPDFRN